MIFYGLAKIYDTGNNRIFIRNFKPSYFSVADIYVSNSFSDGTSASLLEAMACSLTPVVTEIDGNKEWVKDGVNGLLVPVANSKKLAEKILSLVNDYKLRRVLEEKAVETVKARVNWQENTQKLKRIIDEMIYA